RGDLGCRTPLREDALLWRIHLRLRLGGCLRARRRAILPEAVVGRTVHSGPRTPIAGAPRRAGRGSRASPCWNGGVHQEASNLVIACQLSRRRRGRGADRGGVSATARATIPLD